MSEVVIIMGSKSDSDCMKNCEDHLDHFGISYEVKILSAHRNPDEVAEFARNAEKNGIKVIIAAAGMAAHLGGVVAAHTILPVIGVPMKGGIMDGLDALLSIVQMPAGVPVSAMSVGNSGAKNAAITAAQILALSDKRIKEKLIEFKRSGSRI
ncbi:MAG TPA: 5-(carboxyamino)imidazole ribonucleotide mutase [Clostridiales bacterium]|jgi:5-(carboxyamino)imidazole ribonucleotide mutase|nr:5-(carboxyamino)imidazole ribonucleotide mutase [Clostridiales bacterium]HQP70603.1 5-(carboxyamino)imidazole ribonucleotide mutase [Clostridiales bacterium]